MQKADLDDASGRLALSLAFQHATILACAPKKDGAVLELSLDPMDGGWHGTISKSVEFEAPSAINRLDTSYCELTADPGVVGGLRLSLNGTLGFKDSCKDPSANHDLTKELRDDSSAKKDFKEDLLSFDQLVFFGLVLVLRPDGTVETEISRMRLDPASSKARKESLCAQLRLLPKRLVSSKSGALSSQGFESLDGVYAIPKKLDEPWNALVLEFSLGKLGELADSAHLATEIALGWGAAQTRPFAAMKLPGSDLAGRVGLQGIIGLKPGGSGLRLYEEPDGTRRWVLFLRDVQFSLFVLALPPNGGIDMEIAGDPSGAGPPSWYAGYAEMEKR